MLLVKEVMMMVETFGFVSNVVEFVAYWREVVVVSIGIGMMAAGEKGGMGGRDEEGCVEKAIPKCQIISLYDTAAGR